VIRGRSNRFLVENDSYSIDYSDHIFGLNPE